MDREDEWWKSAAAGAQRLRTVVALEPALNTHRPAPCLHGAGLFMVNALFQAIRACDTGFVFVQMPLLLRAPCRVAPWPSVQDLA